MSFRALSDFLVPSVSICTGKRMIILTTMVDIFDIRLLSWETAQGDAGRIRRQVFVVEQAVPEDMEWDEWDSRSVHALAMTPVGQVVGTARLLPADTGGRAKLGRMAVLPEWRRRGAGAALLLALLAEARRRGVREIALHAQMSAAGFYRSHGFIAQGAQFMEAGILHVGMTLFLGVDA
jgi:predicted GNAT family N-acyltransferase